MVENNEPVSTPIFTPSMYSILLTKARLPTNKLMVNPIPVKIETPYKLNQLELFGVCANLNLIDMYENNKTPICFPKNKPHSMPKGTGAIKLDNDSPFKLTPALAKANKGIIINAT